MSKSEHHINAAGSSVVCTAPEISRCRTRTRCDSETWNRNCVDHDGAHRAMPGGECWMTEHLNAIDLRETYEDWQDPPTIIPGAAIDIEFVGSDEGCSWAYAEVTP